MNPSSLPQASSANQVAHSVLWHRLACIALFALITLCVLWEYKLAPLRAGGTWLVIKALPLLLILPGIMRARNRSLQIATLMVWLYFTEGIVRATSEKGLSSSLAWGEVGLSVLLFIACAAYLRPFKRASKIKQVHHQSVSSN